jgi:hypothetical protein
MVAETVFSERRKHDVLGTGACLGWTFCCRRAAPSAWALSHFEHHRAPECVIARPDRPGSILGPLCQLRQLGVGGDAPRLVVREQVSGRSPGARRALCNMIRKLQNGAANWGTGNERPYPLSLQYDGCGYSQRRVEMARDFGEPRGVQGSFGQESHCKRPVI